MIRHLSRAGVLVGVLLLTITPGMAAIQVEVNGRPLSFRVPPTRVSGRTMVPLRGIFESLGAQVNWDATTSTIPEPAGQCPEVHARRWPGYCKYRTQRRCSARPRAGHGSRDPARGPGEDLREVRSGRESCR
jgi:hypothetical protein